MGKVTPPIEGTCGQGDTGTRAKHARGQVGKGTWGQGVDTKIHGRHAVPPLPKQACKGWGKG